VELLVEWVADRMKDTALDAEILKNLARNVRRLRLGAIDTNKHFAACLLLAAMMALAACETGPMLLEKNAQGDELRKETTVGVPLPTGCPTFTTSLPAGKTTLTVSYQEPTTNQTGALLTDLAYTTIYLSSPQAQTKAIRIWTNDAHGGGLVAIRDIPVYGQELGLCVTATNLARKESPPALPTQPKP
jgi:hypothetical protein